MILFINTSRTDLIQVKLIDQSKVVAQLENHEQYTQSELLLGMIEKLLKSAKLKINGLTAIAVVSGPGAFSALRLGITTANTLAWSLQIPVIEVSSDQAVNDETLIKSLPIKSTDFKPVIPKYGSEPNIT